MSHPKLKHPRFCRLLMYIFILGCAGVPIGWILSLTIYDGLKALYIFVIGIILLLYLVRNFSVIMRMDFKLALKSCHNTARTQFSLPNNRTAEMIESAVSHYGTNRTPIPLFPQPDILQFCLTSSANVQYSGIERFVSLYHVDSLSLDSLHTIIDSAKANSQAHSGQKKPLIFDTYQQSSPLSQLTVILILAKQVDPRLSVQMHNAVCELSGDGYRTAVLPCVIDLSQKICVFDSMRLPYCGSNYAVKNRGIKLIKRFVFGGKPNTSDKHRLPPLRDYDPEMSLGAFWRNTHKEEITFRKKRRKQFEKMSDKQIVLIDNGLYLKWRNKGIYQKVRLNREDNTATITAIAFWDYPRVHVIPGTAIDRIVPCLIDFFHQKGYSVDFERDNYEY